MTRMMSQFQLALAGLCGLLAILLGYELGAPAAAPDIPGLVWSAPQITSLTAPPPLPAADSYAAINARPLFSPARKPVASSDQKNAGAAPLPPPELSLVGIIIEGATRMALVRTPASPLEVSVTVGADVGGWQVTAIEPDHIVLRSGTTDHEVNLNSSRPPSNDSNPADSQTSPAQPPAPDAPANKSP